MMIIMRIGAAVAAADGAKPWPRLAQTCELQTDVGRRPLGVEVRIDRGAARILRASRREPATSVYAEAVTSSVK